MGVSSDFVNIENRPLFINPSSQILTNDHIRQASNGQKNALIASRYIDFDLNALNIIEGEKGKFVNVKNTQMVGQDIVIQLPEKNSRLLLHVKTVENLIRGHDVTTYSGSVDDNPESYFTLSIGEEGILGQINHGKYLYLITPLKGKTVKHAISQFNKSLLQKPDADDTMLVADSGKLLKSSNKTSSGRVDVLFYYASDVYWPSIYASAIVSNMNAALQRSGVNPSNYIKSVGLKAVNTNFYGKCNYQIIEYEMIARHGVFANIDQEMISYGADLAMLLTNTYSASNCYPGYTGRVIGWAPRLSSSHPFAIVSHNYALGDLAALHELGHSFGGSHSNVNASPLYARGYTFSYAGQPKQTLMGSYDTPPCNFSGLNNIICERVPYFSNQSKKYPNNSGVPLGNSSHFFYYRLNTTMPIVAAYRGVAVPIPNTPNPIYTVSDNCYGLNTISWASKSGTTEYKLYKSTSPGFNSPSLVYSGSSTSTVINVNSGIWFLRAKACNASGCSAYTNQVTAVRINSCN